MRLVLKSMLLGRRPLNSNVRCQNANSTRTTQIDALLLGADRNSLKRFECEATCIVAFCGLARGGPVF